MNLPRLCRPVFLVATLVLAPGASATPRDPVPVTAAGGMVVAGHPQAAAIGIHVLRAGGNAMDAAVAVSLALGVAEPYGSGLGGRLVMLYREGATGVITALQAVEAASRSLDPAAVARWPSSARSEGATSVCVPALPAGLHAAHARWGRMAWADLVAPAAVLAREGFEVLPLSVRFFAVQEAKLRRHAEIARLYLPGGELPRAGTRLANPDLAATLERYAAEGPTAIYTGPVAEAIVAAVRAGGGVMDLADLTGYAPVFSEPLRFSLAGHEVVTGPPPGTGGVLMQVVFALLPPRGAWPAASLRDPAALDVFARAFRAAYPEVQAAIGDVPDVRERHARLTAPQKLGALRRALAAEAEAPLTGPAETPGTAPAAEATTHFVVADAEGNIACVTQSTGSHFGSGIVPPGTGIVLNNWMNSLTYADARSPNAVAPGRRGRSTTTPTIVLRDGVPVLALGVPGGQRIPSGVAQVLADVLLFDRDPAAAIGDVRFHIVRPASRRESRNVIEIEPAADPALRGGLERRGWTVQPVDNPEHFGGVNAVVWSGGVLTGLADPRRTNAAAGLD